MRNSAVFALSSKWEGLPTVLIEALALGATVVSTNCKSGPEEILRGGSIGRLVPVGDIEALSEAIVESLNNDKNIPEKEYLQQYEPGWAVDEYLKVIEGVSRG